MKPEHGVEKPQPGALAHAASALVHILLLFPVLYIVGLGIENYSFFSWHPICMALGAGLLAIEAVFSISGEANVSKKLSRPGRVTLHWILHLVGMCLLVAGLAIIVVNKERHGHPHFGTSHGQLGLATIVIVFLIGAFGILANNARWFYPQVRPVLIKVTHAFAGIGLTVLLLATVINGTYRAWWTNIGASETGRGLVFASLVIAGFVVLVKPIIGAISRSRVLGQPPPSAPVAMTDTVR
ncbi:PREDICTED: cytochrome b561 domain-containing protein 2-like [Ceratosolen solmsi marchali]|uniref:ascorbate ferrireductase (transmembrane) n=1 Tax=Ceratosolen solmsi marchali TaxID=326594 RepID=A0AAJ6YPQ8_9HYME|nr:PREDICTED: cytochrome b561 domain-containing protein 2-like [Ceratosolen solmsi marchali]